MKIKINWGIGITVFFALFVLFLIVNLFFASLQKNDLVTEDYYQEQLQYQKQIDKQGNANALAHDLKIIQAGSALAFQFPIDKRKENISGEIYFYRPSNKGLDRKFPIALNEENTQIIDIREFNRGSWKIKVDWKDADTAYYHEENLFF